LEIVLHPPADDRADASEGVAHKPEHCTIPKADEFARIDRLQQLAPPPDSTGVLPRVTTNLGPRTEPAGVETRTPPVTR
jgi:hypothetical protein